MMLSARIIIFFNRKLWIGLNGNQIIYRFDKKTFRFTGDKVIDYVLFVFGSKSKKVPLLATPALLAISDIEVSGDAFCSEIGYKTASEANCAYAVCFLQLCPILCHPITSFPSIYTFLTFRSKNLPKNIDL